MKFLRIFGFLLLLVVTSTAAGYFFWYKPRFKAGEKSFINASREENNAFKLVLERLSSKSVEIAEYAYSNKYNTQYAFLIDMSIAPGKQRFFVYNLITDSIELAGLVTHGSGLTREDNITFSNVPGSYCTSLGKYKIGKPYHGKFGLAYKLYGLNKSNSNAFERFVVLHAHGCVPDEEVYPVPICESWGCPTVSPAFLQKLTSYIDNSRNPILLWIYK